MMITEIAAMYAREMQRDLRAETAAEALARRLAPGPLDHLRAALRSHRAMPAPTPVARLATALTSQAAGR